jgi:glycosyltransferase involved in cell wall biosynthesis
MFANRVSKAMSETETKLALKDEPGSHERNIGSVVMLVFSDQGGLADYAHEQACELVRRGVDLTVLCKKRFAADRKDAPYRVRCLFVAEPKRIQAKRLRQLVVALVVVLNEWIAAGYIALHRPKAVLKDGFSELMAPFWFLPHLLLARICGVTYAVNLHDPDRIRFFGPHWWHRVSVRAGYAMNRIILVHDARAKGTELAPRRAAVVEVPHGILHLPQSSEELMLSGIELRAKYGIPQGAPLLLSFGFVADRKNIDLVIRALPRVPDAYLLVAGRVASSRDRSVNQYAELAQQVGVADRVVFEERFVPAHEITSFFQAADIILLTYKSGFVSQSGVLHLASNWDKPVLATSGRGPLTETVTRHNLGVVVEPDSVEDLIEGLNRLISGRFPALGWAGFREGASWKINIDRFLDALAGTGTPSGGIGALAPLSL